MGRRPWLVLGVAVMGLVASFAIAARADATPFSQTINFANSFNVSETSKFNYGFTDLALEPSIVGPGVTISSVRASGVGVTPGGTINFDWQVFLGPAGFGLTPGGVVASSTSPDTLTPNSTTAPTQFNFAIGRLTDQSAATINFSGSHDFLANTSSASPVLSQVKAAFTSPLNLSSGLFAQMFLWTEDPTGVNIDFSDLSLTVTGTMPSAVPEPSSLSLVGTGMAGLLFLLSRSRRRRLAG